MTAPKETFVKVPTFIHEAVGRGQLSPRALALYVMLRSHRNHRNQTAWPSLTTLAKEMNMKNSRNLIKYIGELEALGAILITKEVGTSNTYIFPETSASGGNTSGDTTEENSTGSEWTGTSWDTTTSTSGGIAPVPAPVLAPVPQQVPKLDRGNQIKESDQIERPDDSASRLLRALDVGRSISKPRSTDWHDMLCWLGEELGRHLEQTEELYVRQKLLPTGMSYDQILASLRERVASRANARAESGFAKPGALSDEPWSMPR